MACRLPLLLSCALLAAAALPLQAAELGEPRVSSFIGQPLVADIELTMLEDAATPVAVRLAHPNVYRGANIGMPAVLSTLRMSVMRRDGRQFLHVTSLAPVESEHLHLYLELADGTQRTVRLATLWLSPDPHPVPAIAAPAPVAAAVPAPAPVMPPSAAKAAEPQPAPAPMRSPAPKPVPSAPKPAEPQPVAPKPASSRPKPAAAPSPAAAAAPHGAEPAPTGGSCAPQPQQQVDACVMLGAKNAVLREQLGQLEDRVRVLQVAAGASPAAVMQPMAGQKPRPKPKKKKPEPEQKPEEGAGAPWLLAGAAGGVLALLAGLVVALRRRKAARHAGGSGAGAMARLKARLEAGLRRKTAPSAAREPSLEGGAHESSTQV